LPSALTFLLSQDSGYKMGYHIIGADLTEVTFIDNGTVVVLEDTTDTLELGGDIQLKPTVTSTSHIETTGSLRVRATDNMHIGDQGVDSIRIGRTNTALAKVYVRSGSDNDLVISDGKVGIGMDDPSHSLEIDGDIQLSPTAISTAHIDTAGSLKIDAANNMQIGHTGADSVRIGRTNTGLAKVHVRSGADTDLVVSNSKVGIGTDTPTQALDVAGDVKLAGGQTVAVRSLTNSDSTYTVVASDYVLSCDTSSGVLVITLPAASSVGRMLHICDTSGAADSNAITINVASSGSETIQGDTSLVINGEYASATIVNVATNKWSVL